MLFVCLFPSLLIVKGSSHTWHMHTPPCQHVIFFNFQFIFLIQFNFTKVFECIVIQKQKTKPLYSKVFFGCNTKLLYKTMHKKIKYILIYMLSVLLLPKWFDFIRFCQVDYKFHQVSKR